MLSRWSRAATARRVAGTWRPRISARSNRRKRRSFHLLRSRRMAWEKLKRMIQRGGSARVKTCLVMISERGLSGSIRSDSISPYWERTKVHSRGSVSSEKGLRASMIQRSGAPFFLRTSPTMGSMNPESNSFRSGVKLKPRASNKSEKNSLWQERRSSCLRSRSIWLRRAK